MSFSLAPAYVNSRSDIFRDMGGYSELVKQKVLGEINLEQENALGKILEQSMDLLTMINGLLHVTTIEVLTP